MPAHRRFSAALAVGLSALAALAPSASAGIANGGLPGASPSNPLAGLGWGNYDGRDDEVFPAYNQASGETRRLLGLVATRPRMRWFGQWYADPTQAARDYIENVTGSDPSALAQMAVFGMQPWENDICRRLPSAGEQRAYRDWIDGLATGIGAARVAMVLQPDLPFALCVPHHSLLPLQMIAYAAEKFSTLPHTTIYLDAGASDWLTVGQAATMLRQAGIRYARGFALGATHYAATQDEIRFGAHVARALAAAGIRGRRFVINTAQNGRPFTYQQYHLNYDNARVCATRRSQRCVTLGIPPTTNVTDRRLRLSVADRGAAQSLVDGYLWIGRPWLDNQNDPFDLQRTLALVRTTPF